MELDARIAEIHKNLDDFKSGLIEDISKLSLKDICIMTELHGRVMSLTMKAPFDYILTVTFKLTEEENG